MRVHRELQIQHMLSLSIMLVIPHNPGGFCKNFLYISSHRITKKNISCSLSIPLAMIHPEGI